MPEHDGDIVLRGQADGVAGQHHARGNPEALCLVGRHRHLPVAGPHQEAFAFLPQTRTESVDEQLHGVSATRSTTTLADTMQAMGIMDEFERQPSAMQCR